MGKNILLISNLDSHIAPIRQILETDGYTVFQLNNFSSEALAELKKRLI